MCFDLGDVKVERDIVTFNEEEDEDTLVEEGPHLNAARCCTGTHATVRCTKETFVTSDSRVKRDLTWAMSKRRKIIVTFNEREDEDILNDADEDEDSLVEDGPQIDLGTVFLWDTCHREIYQRNSRGERFPREACFDLVDVEVDETHCDLIWRGG